MAAIMLLVISAGVALQFPTVQTKLAQYAAGYLSEESNHKILIDYIGIDFFDTIEIKGVKIYDPDNRLMVDAGEIDIDIEIISLLEAKVVIEEIAGINARFMLVKKGEDHKVNIDQFVRTIKEVLGANPNRKKKKPFEVEQVRLENCFLSYNDISKEVWNNQFDHRHFELDSIYTTMPYFRIKGDSATINFRNLRAVNHKTGLRIKKLNTNFEINQGHLALDSLEAYIGNSLIKDKIIFRYDSISQLSYLTTQVDIDADFKNSVLTSHDLKHFFPDLKNFHDVWTLSGEFRGKIINFAVNDFQLKFGRGGSRLDGYIAFDGILNFPETVMDLKFNNSPVDADDLNQYIPNYNKAGRFGDVIIDGEFQGFPYDFVTYGTFVTSIGKLTTDIRFDINKEDESQSMYTGKLITENFDIGTYLRKPKLLQKIDMNGQVQGRGFTMKDARLEINADIYKFGVNNYNFKNITANALLEYGFFNGKITVNDTNLVLSADGKIDFRENRNLFDIKANLEKADLQAINISKKESFVISNLDLEFKGIKPDEIVGWASFNNSYLAYENRDLLVDSLYMSSQKDKDGNRNFILTSDLIDVKLEGQFEFTEIISDAINLYQEYKLNFLNDRDKIKKYYQNKSDKDRPYGVDFTFNIKDINSILRMYYPSLEISGNTEITGQFFNGYTSILNFQSHIDTFRHEDIALYDAYIDISSSKISDSSSVLASLFLTSEKQKIKTFPETENFTTEIIWDGRKINFNSFIEDEEDNSYISLSGIFEMLREGTKLSITDSRVFYLDKLWQLEKGNEIRFKGKEVAFNNLSFYHEKELISATGAISDTSFKDAGFNMTNFKLENINPFLQSNEFYGTVNGSFTIKDFYKNMFLEGYGKIDSFVIDKVAVGDIAGDFEWDNPAKKLDINIKLNRKDSISAELKGYYKPEAPEREKLNMAVQLNQTEISMLEPLFNGILNDVKGTATGKFKVKGSLQNIILLGEADIKNGSFTAGFLNTAYTFDDKVFFEENMIGFKDLKLIDKKNNILHLEGGIFHDGFRDFIVNINGHGKDVKVLNTTIKDNELFYGEAYATGKFEILGPFDNLKIIVNARNTKNSTITIPMETEVVEQANYIQFVDKKSKKTREDTVVESDVDLSGVYMEFNLEITPELTLYVNFDERAGDIMKVNGRSNGNMKMVIDTRGDFTMNGEYIITKGTYNFTLANLINKQFNIEQNSSITWNGDPYQGILDVTSTYRQPASLAPITYFSPAGSQDSLQNQVPPELQKRYSTIVVLKLRDQLLTPTINFDIRFEDYPKNLSVNGVPLDNYVASFTNDIRNNEQELNRQVFSLLVLKKLSPPGTFEGVLAAGNNISELLSNQLSSWLSQVDPNLEVDIGVNNLEQINSFQLRLSYTFLDGRLRITRDGSFTNVDNKADVSSIAGEWTVEYMLTQNGKLRVKMYNRNNYNNIRTTLQDNNTTTAGFSILHTESFNSLKDLFEKDVHREDYELEKENERDWKEITGIKEEDDGNEKKKKKKKGDKKDIDAKKEDEVFE